MSVYEAGFSGFVLHRVLESSGIARIKCIFCEIEMYSFYSSEIHPLTNYQLQQFSGIGSFAL